MVSAPPIALTPKAALGHKDLRGQPLTLASGLGPEHTLATYDLAIEQDADVIQPAACQHGDDAGGHGDLDGEIAACLRLGIDAFFSDYPARGVDAREAWAMEIS